MASERRPRQEWRVPRGRTWGGSRGDQQGYLRLLVAHMLFQRAEWGSVPVQFYLTVKLFLLQFPLQNVLLSKVMENLYLFCMSLYSKYLNRKI